MFRPSLSTSPIADPSPPVATSRRDPRLDTAKGVLITLVVLGHLLEAIDHWQAGAARVPLTLLYAFHMPAFVFLAGITASTRAPWRRVLTVLLLLVTFQLVYFAEWSLLESSKAFVWHEPFWLLWFLLAMAWWQTLAPLVARVPGTALALSLVVALGAGAIDAIGAPLALSRALVLLPFFVLGITHGSVLLRLVDRLSRRHRLLSLGATVIALTLVVAADPGRGWLYASSGYATLGAGLVDGIATRAALLATAALATFTLVAWLPPRDVGGLTTAGRRSLGIYLLHGLVVMALTPMLAGVLDEHGAFAAWTLCIVAVSGIVTLLATPGPDRLLRAGSAAVIERALPDGR